METIGATLKAAREKQNLSREEVAKATRLKTAYIEWIENNDFHRLIAPVYAKGFIRLYAQCVQIDPQPLLRQFAALEPTVQPAPAAPQKPSRKPAFPEKTIWNPGAYAKIVINACRKIKLPAMDKIRMPALKPIPAPAVKWIAVAAAAAVCAVILSALVQKVSSSRPALKASPACRWIADPPEPYLEVTARKTTASR